MSTAVPVPGPPRRVRFLAALGPGAAFLALFGASWLLVGSVVLAAFLASGGPPWEDWMLASRARRVEATPVAVEATSAHANGRRVMEVRFRFRDELGAEHAASSHTMDPALVEKARRGEPLAAEYDPSKPERARLVGTRISFFGAFVAIPLVAALAGAALLAAGLRAAAGRRRLLAEGEAATGRVESVTPTPMNVNGKRVLAIRYTFPGPYGPLEGVMKDVLAPPPGSDVTVLYDPRRPERNVLVRPRDFV